MIAQRTYGRNGVHAGCADYCKLLVPLGDLALVRHWDEKGRKMLPATYLRSKKHALSHYMKVDDLTRIHDAGKNIENVCEELLRCSAAGNIGNAMFHTKVELVSYAVYKQRLPRYMEDCIDQDFSDESVATFKDIDDKFHWSKTETAQRCI